MVVITGASAGVGRATARAFARRGARVTLIARGEEGLEATRGEVEALGGRALAISADVADAEGMEMAAAATESAFGRIDIWVNNAMATVLSPVKEMTADEYRRVTEVTYLGCVYGTLAALKRMLPRNRGIIVQVGSALAYRSIPLQSAYCGAKHAIKGFTDALRSELLHDRSRVCVTMVQLPALNTPQFDWAKNRLPNKMQPVPPVFQPELAADAIVWAAHHHRRELHLAFSSLRAIWANKFFPGLIDRYLARAGYAGQQTDEPEEANRPDNLWQPVPGDHGAHGRFDAIAQARSTHWRLSRHRTDIALAGLIAVAAGWWLGGRRRNLGRPSSH